MTIVNGIVAFLGAGIATGAVQLYIDHRRRLDAERAREWGRLSNWQEGIRALHEARRATIRCREVAEFYSTGRTSSTIELRLSADEGEDLLWSRHWVDALEKLDDARYGLEGLALGGTEPVRRQIHSTIATVRVLKRLLEASLTRERASSPRDLIEPIEKHQQAELKQDVQRLVQEVNEQYYDRPGWLLGRAGRGRLASP